MYCNKVKKGKHCIIYTLQLNLAELNLDLSSSVRRIFQSSVVKTLPCSGCFTACMSAHFPLAELGYVDRMTHCGMIRNGMADPSEFQLTSLRRIEVLAGSFDTDFKCGRFWQWNVIREMESVMILQSVEILRFSKVLISLVWAQFKPV